MISITTQILLQINRFIFVSKCLGLTEKNRRCRIREFILEEAKNYTETGKYIAEVMKSKHYVAEGSDGTTELQVDNEIFRKVEEL